MATRDADVIKVFVVDRGRAPLLVGLLGVSDLATLVAAVQRKFGLSDADARDLELRVVEEELDSSTAASLFDISRSVIKNSSSLPRGGSWVVGKIESTEPRAPFGGDLGEVGRHQRCKRLPSWFLEFRHGHLVGGVSLLIRCAAATGQREPFVN